MILRNRVILTLTCAIGLSGSVYCIGGGDPKRGQGATTATALSKKVQAEIDQCKAEFTKVATPHKKLLAILRGLKDTKEVRGDKAPPKDTEPRTNWQWISVLPNMNEELNAKWPEFTKEVLKNLGDYNDLHGVINFLYEFENTKSLNKLREAMDYVQFMRALDAVIKASAELTHKQFKDLVTEAWNCVINRSLQDQTKLQTLVKNLILLIEMASPSPDRNAYASPSPDRNAYASPGGLGGAQRVSINTKSEVQKFGWFKLYCDHNKLDTDPSLLSLLNQILQKWNGYINDLNPDGKYMYTLVREMYPISSPQQNAEQQKWFELAAVSFGGFAPFATPG